MGPKVHVGSLDVLAMDDWKPLAIEPVDGPIDGVAHPEITDGLNADAATLQAAFEATSTHLDDVRQRHEQVLITAGMLPETDVANRLPERALDWVVSGLNGRVNPDGLSIPLLGAHLEDVHLEVNTTENATTVRLRVDEEGHDSLTREMTLPEGVNSTLMARWVNGHLHLRW